MKHRWWSTPTPRPVEAARLVSRLTTDPETAIRQLWEESETIIRSWRDAQHLAFVTRRRPCWGCPGRPHYILGDTLGADLDAHACPTCGLYTPGDDRTTAGECRSCANRGGGPGATPRQRGR